MPGCYHRATKPTSKYASSSPAGLYQLDVWSGVPIWRQSGGDCLIQVTAKAGSTVLVLQYILGYQNPFSLDMLGGWSDK